jgi:hypothetical protein
MLLLRLGQSLAQTPNRRSTRVPFCMDRFDEFLATGTCDCESVPSGHTLRRDRDSEVSQPNQIAPSSVLRHLVRGDKGSGISTLAAPLAESIRPRRVQESIPEQAEINQGAEVRLIRLVYEFFCNSTSGI